jgi:hypothetical protein
MFNHYVISCPRARAPELTQVVIDGITHLLFFRRCLDADPDTIFEISGSRLKSCLGRTLRDNAPVAASSGATKAHTVELAGHGIPL